MDYQTFLRKTKGTLVENLFQTLDILKKYEIFLKINNTPDYDLSEYAREITTNYYFQNNWDFENEFEFIIEATFNEKALFHYDHIIELSKKYKLSYDSNSDSFSDIIYLSYQKEKESFSEYSYKPDLDNYTLNTLNIIGMYPSDQVHISYAINSI